MEYKNSTELQKDKIFEFKDVTKKRLIVSLSITLIVMFIEIIGGLVANSIALISDSGHMFTHAFAITISLVAIYLSQKPRCHHRTFGLYRTEILAAFINGLFLLVIVCLIIIEAIERILNPVSVASLSMIFIAIIGLSVNIFSVLILQGSQKNNINVKGVFYHMIGDAISSIGVVFAAIIIYFTNLSILDPIVSFLIAGLIVLWAIGILKDSGRILLEMTPSGLDIHMIEKDLIDKFVEIKEIEHTHLWTITTQLLVLTTHIRVNENVNHDQFVSKITDFLHSHYNITESTVQVSYSEGIKSCNM
ncbi:MAG: cation diffusion facilitator family transporter [Candidatus Lokiarchaeota archaeon]|nr:cation diffusion facilitator family transporter [Candidatus Lokiarchaeota archaeon]MBD3202106.1 cation diffusion facilitator family transporter [Candidatus Lokiarchaeota archaeon]